MIRKIELGDRITDKTEKGERKDIKRITKTGEKKAQKILGYNHLIKYEIEFKENEYVNKKMRGVTGRIRECEEAEIKVVIWMDPSVEDWRKGLKTIVPHETAHTRFYISKGKHYSKYMKWERLLNEGLAQIVAEKAEPEIDNWWRTEYSRKEIGEKWRTVKKELKKYVDFEEMPLFFGDGEKFPDAFGYSIAYRIGKKLLKKHELNKFHKITREEAFQTGDDLFT